MWLQKRLSWKLPCKRWPSLPRKRKKRTFRVFSSASHRFVPWHWIWLSPVVSCDHHCHRRRHGKGLFLCKMLFLWLLLFLLRQIEISLVLWETTLSVLVSTRCFVLILPLFASTPTISNFQIFYVFFVSWVGMIPRPNLWQLSCSISNEIWIDR